MSRLTIASRGSKLALWQANYVADRIRQEGVEVEISVIKTTGDRVQDRFLHEIGGKGLFVREIEDALAAGEADIAVHSLKDLPAKVPAGFTLAAILKRHSPADALIVPPDKAPPAVAVDGSGMASLPFKTLGTASLRRSALLARFAPHIETVGLRGNVDTRIEKLNRGEFDAILLAEASLERLGWQDLPYTRLAPEWFIPCAAQGALAIETREDSDWRTKVGAWFDHAPTRRAAQIERALLAGVGGDCTMPFGAYYDQDRHTLCAGVYATDGSHAECELTDIDGGTSEDEVITKALPALHAAGLPDIMKKLSLELPANFAARWL